MANTQRGNKIFIDTTGEVTTKKTLVSYILFTPDAANDQLLLKEESGGADVFYIRQSTAKNTEMYDFSLKPLVFENGIYVQTITSGAKAVLITTQAGT